ncbi:hypothetical protein, partial [Salinisphaera sp.]|uniref:hypothetical protein n=1 Tax=Salinisphaera sp. TaxID=1914330 RepID=UPI0025D1A489
PENTGDLLNVELQMKPQKIDNSWRGQRQGSGLEIADAPARATGRGDLMVQLIYHQPRKIMCFFSVSL